jgi:hypothetical protein
MLSQPDDMLNTKFQVNGQSDSNNLTTVSEIGSSTTPARQSSIIHAPDISTASYPAGAEESPEPEPEPESEAALSASVDEADSNSGTTLGPKEVNELAGNEQERESTDESASTDDAADTGFFSLAFEAFIPENDTFTVSSIAAERVGLPAKLEELLDWKPDEDDLYHQDFEA